MQLEWISVDTQLPLEGQTVLICYQVYVGVSIFRSGGFCALGIFLMSIGEPIARASHWMPFPEAFAVEGSGVSEAQVEGCVVEDQAE